MKIVQRKFLEWAGPLWASRPWLEQCIDIHVHLYYAAVQNLIYRCGNVPQITSESSYTPPIYCTQHVQQFVDMSIQVPAGLQCNPVQMAEFQQQVQVAWTI